MPGWETGQVIFSLNITPHHTNLLLTNEKFQQTLQKISASAKKD